MPAGITAFAHRGPAHLVRLLPGSKLLYSVNDLAFTTDPSDNTTLCVPHHIIEGVYGRFFVPDASVSAADLQFGSNHISVDQLLLAEQSLPASFDSSQCGLDAFIRRVEREAMRPERQTLTLRAADFAASQPFNPADGPDERWLSEVSVSDLVDANGRLSTYGDLALIAKSGATSSGRVTTTTTVLPARASTAHDSPVRQPLANATRRQTRGLRRRQSTRSASHTPTHERSGQQASAPMGTQITHAATKAASRPSRQRRHAPSHHVGTRASRSSAASFGCLELRSRSVCTPSESSSVTRSICSSQRSGFRTH